VAWILVYAGLFAAGLVYLRSKSPFFERRGEAAKTDLRGRAADASGGKPGRDDLLGGTGVPAAARTRYFERLATERCNCGCERSLADCMVNEKSCSRSPMLAGEVWRQSRK
jgi:hypothetical protein